MSKHSRKTNRNRTKQKRRRQRQQHTRRQRSDRVHAPSIPMLGGVPWLVLDGQLPGEHSARDGSIAIAICVNAATAQFGHAVFDKGGMLAELLLASDGEAALTQEEREVMRDFELRRCAIGDPAFAELPPEASHPRASIARGFGPMPTLRHYTYEVFEPAFDGSRTVLVGDSGEPRALLLIDADGALVHGLATRAFTDEAGADDRDAALDFTARRSEVADPFFEGLAAELKGGRTRD